MGIAAANDSTMTADELQVLLPTAMFQDPDQVTKFIRADPELRHELTLIDDEIVPRADPTLLTRRDEGRRLAEQRIQIARDFAATLQRFCPGLELLAISGSVAYGRTRLEDDIDFFLVAGADRMWITLLSAMVLARLARLRRRDLPVLCFNRTEEAEGTRDRFQASGEPLFAREALNLKVLVGTGFYHDLLESSPWMERWFPSLYRMRLTGTTPEPSRRTSGASTLTALGNVVAMVVLGPFLWLVGGVRNARLRKEGRDKALFRTVVERRFCAYESKKYEDLGDEYRRTFA